MFVSQAQLISVGVIRLISSTVHTLVAIKSLEIFSQGGLPFEQPFSAVEGPKECVRSEISRCGIWPGQRGQQAHPFSRSQREDLEKAAGSKTQCLNDISSLKLRAHTVLHLNSGIWFNMLVCQPFIFVLSCDFKHFVTVLQQETTKEHHGSGQ